MPFVVEGKAVIGTARELKGTGMTHYLLAVHGPAQRNELGGYASKEAMEAAFAATGAFNDKLRADGY